nr:testosterone 17-beta-dehydrogenase 3-like isoform X3 [Oncorhynchus nerka]
MDFMEVFFVSLGTAVMVFYGVKMVRFAKMFHPRVWFPQPESFFTSMGEWAVVTGGSDGIGRAYAFELAGRGLNVVILSRTKDKLDRVALEIEETTGQKVKVIVADFTEDDMYECIKEKLKDLNIGVLVNNVGILPSHIPCKFLQTKYLEQKITKVINCNVKALVKMCQIVLPGMEMRCFWREREGNDREHLLWCGQCSFPHIHHVLRIKGSGSLWRVHPHDRLPEAQHGDPDSRGLCQVVPGVPPSRGQDLRQHLSHSTGLDGKDCSQADPP